MTTPRDVQPLVAAVVATPEFQRAFRGCPHDSYAWRLLKGLERLALGTTKKQERAQRAQPVTATVHTLRQSTQKETGNAGIPERLSV